MDEPTVVVIGMVCGQTSRGPIAVGEYLRLPTVEALQLHALGSVALGDWHDQQLPDPVQTRRGRYQRRDLRADL